MYKFYKAIHGKEKISVIAEIKRKSPSYGKFPERNIDELIRQYETGNASAISVVTNREFFDGSMELLRKICSKTSLPVIRKDFIQTENEVIETALAGAGAILLIARDLEKAMLRKLIRKAHQCEIDPVVEIHDEQDFEKIRDEKEIIIGINNRNLATLTTDVFHAEKLLEKIDPTMTIIAESAFTKSQELLPYWRKIDAVLIGTTFLISRNPQKTLLSFTCPQL